MTRLIDADKIPWTDLSDGRGLCYVTFLEKVQRLPTVKETPVKHGKWTKIPSADLGTCSCCGDKWGFVSVMNYCPNCGAKMDL